MAITFEVKQKPAVEFDVEGVRVIEVGTGGSKPYEGDYDVTPKTYEPVVLPTRNRLLSRDVNVAKIPQYEVSNAAGGLTLIMGDEYMNS